MKNTEFTMLLESEMIRLEERNGSSSMTVKQRDKVSSLGRSGWEIKKRDEDKVVMQKADKELFVYSSGKTFAITEGKEEDVTQLTDALMESEEDWGILIEESVFASFINKFRSPSARMKFYSNGRNGVIAVAKVDGTTSIYHTINKEVVFESSTISDEALADYLEKYEQQGYRKIKNKATLFRVIGAIAATGAIAMGAGVLAGMGFRLVAGLAVMREQTQNQAIVGDNQEAIDELSNRIDQSVQMKGDEVVLDTQTMDVPLGEDVFGERTSILDLMWKGGVFAVTAPFKIAGLVVNMLNRVHGYE